MVLMPKAAFKRSCAAWLAEFKPEPPNDSLPGSFLAASMNSAKFLMPLLVGTTKVSGV